MVYDDDTSRRGEYDIRSEDRPPDRGPKPSLPAQDVQDDILSLGRRPGWDAERIHEHYRIVHNRHDISMAAIRYVLHGTRVGR
ncbi:hypothetical protein ABZ816_25455 [Actinosynnema sp. NPDC047251]|uniref:hypothetical protein n=1 Tax=Saccharothrix espanaensis TaxID=103731 RepID=UPI00059DB0EC|nr:hypothetical protein [Saccharothrix espanaensis]